MVNNLVNKNTNFQTGWNKVNLTKNDNKSNDDFKVYTYLNKINNNRFYIVVRYCYLNVDNIKGVFKFINENFSEVGYKLKEISEISKKFNNIKIDFMFLKVKFSFIKKNRIYIWVNFYERKDSCIFEIIIENLNDKREEEIIDVLKEYISFVNKEYENFCLLKLKILGGVDG